MNFLRNITYLIILILLTIPGSVLAQPELDIKPNRIEFEDLFNRIEHAFLVNKGDQVLSIDSVAYKEDDYIVEYENGLVPPFIIYPDDSIKMTVMLTSFYNITVNDTSDTMFIFNNGIEPVEPLRVRIRFFEDEFGVIEGIVRDTLSVLPYATVHFLYNGIYLLNSVTTNAAGYYQATLPEGEYTVAAEQEGYYTLFHDSTFDPYFAKVVNVDSGSVTNIDFTLRGIEDTSYYIKGKLYDSLNNTNLEKGIIIIRRGTHVPINKPAEGNFLIDTIEVVAGFLNPDGTFKVNVQQPKYYYVQAYTNYFLPGYFNEEGNASVYWQNADTVLIDTSVINKDIFLVRDSSYGGGDALGYISYNYNRGNDLYSGITIFAKSLSTNALYSYNFGKEDGTFKITNLPYGQYELMAQRIGLEDAYSQIINIDPLNPVTGGINIVFNISAVEDENLQPDEFELYQNYPNPFNPTTTISFYLSETTDMKITVNNILGETLTTLKNESIPAGFHEFKFDASGLSSGVYFVVFKSDSFFKTQKILLLK